MGIANVIFILLLAAAVMWFTRNVKKVIRNIRLGNDADFSDNPSLRWMTMARVALGP
ncbi:MAG: Fe-S oxidoreductase, partial [Bacteroidia bacterium]|nr:Fe-S oxidoreductase [Bacteroidia bacterium]